MTTFKYFDITTEQADIAYFTRSILFLTCMLVLFIKFLLHFTSHFNILFLPPLYLFLDICLFLSWLK